MNQTAFHRLQQGLEGLGKVTLLCIEVTQSIFSHKMCGRDLVYQIYFIGVKSQSVILITGAFTGMVLCAQTFYQFHKVKMDTATLAVVAVTLCSELGPVLTALMVAGRVGAAMAAELGTMRVTEQIDALRTLATHPVDYLLVPRLMATMIAMPLLTAESIVLGIGSAYAVGIGLLGIDPAYAWYNMLKYTSLSDVLMGLTKCCVFGGIIANASSNASKILTGLEEGHGLAGRLMKDEQISGQFGQVLSNLNVLSSNLTRFGLLYKPKPVKTSTTPAVKLYPGKNPFN